MKKERTSWFQNFKKEHPFPTQENILKFHSKDDLGVAETSIKMKRTSVETVSITSIEKDEEQLRMFYQDLLTGEQRSGAF